MNGLNSTTCHPASQPTPTTALGSTDRTISNSHSAETPPNEQIAPDSCAKHDRGSGVPNRRGASGGQTECITAIAELDERGAHFVLCRYDKRAIAKEWQKSAPDLRCVEAHVADGGLVGVIPASLGCVVIDVDDGGADGVERVISVLGKPIAVLPTRRADGFHVWYRAPCGTVRNRKWGLKGAVGDVRGSNGYAILWDSDGLADAYTRFYDAAEPVSLDRLPSPARNRQRGPAAVKGATNGERNDVLNRQAFRAAQDGSLDKEAFREAGVETGLPRAEVDVTLSSAVRAGLAAAVEAAFSEGGFSRLWAKQFGSDEFLYAQGDCWVRFEGGRWYEAESLARQTMSRVIRVEVEGTKVAKIFDCHRVVCGALSMAQYERTVSVDSFDSNRLYVPYSDGTLLNVEGWNSRPAEPSDRIRRTLSVKPDLMPSQEWTEFLWQALSHYPKAERQRIASSRPTPTPVA